MRTFSFLINLFIVILIVTTVSSCRNPKQDQLKKSHDQKEIPQEGISDIEFLKIEPAGPYIFEIQFHRDPQQQFRLWFPEVVIFNQDTSRGTIDESEGKEWFEKTPDGYLVSGKIGNNDMWVDFKYKIKPVSEEEIRIELEVKNAGKLPWSDYAQLAACLAPDNQAFSDKVGDRTYINTENNVLHSLNEAGVVDDFNHYPVTPRNDLTDSVQRVQVASGFVSRSSTDGKTNISFYWDETARVDVNPGGLDCIHSDPAIGPLEPGENIVRKGVILLRKGTVLESYKLLRNQP